MADLLLGEFVITVGGEPGLGPDEDADFLHRFAGPRKSQKFGLGVIAVIGIANDLDEVVKVGQGDEVAFEFLGLDFGFVEEEAGAAEDHLAAMLDVAGDGVLERKQLGPAVVDGQHVDAEGGFQRGVLEKIIDDDLGIAIALEVDHNAGVLGAFIAHVADAGEDLLIGQVGDAFDQIGPIHVVGNLGDDDLFASALHLGHADTAAHAHLAAAGFEILFDARGALKDAAGGEVRTLHVGHESLNGDIGVGDLRANAINAFAKVVRRDVGGHTDGNAGAAIDEKIREGCGKNSRFLAGLVVVGNEIDRALVHVGHESGSEVLQAGLGVSHGGGRIAFHAAEVSLSIDKHFAHGPGLGHVNEGGINRLVAVRMVVAHRFSHDLGALEVLAVRLHAEFVHGVEDAALGGLESVTRIGQRTGNDDRHRVVEEGLRHLLGHVHFFDFFVLIIHAAK